MEHTIVGTRARHSTKDDQTGLVGRHGHTGEGVRRQAVVCAQRERRCGRVELWVRTEFFELLIAGTYGKDQNIIGDLIVCCRDLSTDNVHGRLRWHIDSLMPPSSGRVQPKRYRDQSQCRKKNWLHHQTMPDRGEVSGESVILVERVVVCGDLYSCPAAVEEL